MPTTSLTLTVSDLVFNQGEEIRTNSLKVAEAFNKQHRDVVRKLRTLECSDEFNARNFAHVEYRDKKGELRNAFEMTKDGFMFLVMGFTGKKAAQIKEAYIDAFNQMANKFRSSLPTLPPSQYQLPSNCLPNFYDSGWLPALYKRCDAASIGLITLNSTFAQRVVYLRLSLNWVLVEKERVNRGSHPVAQSLLIAVSTLSIEIWKNCGKTSEKY